MLTRIDNTAVLAVSAAINTTNRYGEASLDRLRRGWFAKLCSVTTTLIFSSMFYFLPAAEAVAYEVTKDDQRRELRLQQQQMIHEKNPEAALAYRLQTIKERVLHELPNRMAEREASISWLDQAFNSLGLGDLPLTEQDLQELHTLKTQIQSAYHDAIDSFTQSANWLTTDAQAQSLPASTTAQIQARQQQAEQLINERYTTLLNTLSAVLNATKRDQQYQALDQLEQFLQQQQFKRQHTPDDPTQLPWGTPDSNVREPVTDRRDLQAMLGINPLAELPQLASVATSTHSGTSGLISAAQMATLMGTDQPKPEHLASTLEVSLSPEIQQLAASLNHNPTEIYSWVHNNIRFVPSHGSIQGAEHTLHTQRGNAIDTASLLIALLRAANIPARYAYGTVEIPIDKAQNWVGNVNNADAVLNLMGQGGIPSIGQARGGVITHIRFEHTWVEAYVDFEPSRGVKHQQGDSWIPMDASFKQYDYQAGMNLQDHVPFDAQSLIDTIEQQATVNEEQGWVQGVPQADVEAQLQQFQTQLEDYINNQNPDATVGDVLGLQTINIIPPRALTAGLPYHHIVTSQRFSDVPSNLRHKFRYQLATQTQGHANSAFISIEEPTVKLAGQSLAVSFAPATDDDQAIIDSYLPQPDPITGEIDPTELPNTLPGYLIELTGEFTLGQTAVASGSAGVMGGELQETLGLWSPAHGWNTATNHPVAGEYRAIGLDLQGMSPEQAVRLQANVEATKTKLESNNDTQLASLTKHDLVGDLLYGTIFSYFALNDVQDQLQAQTANVVTYRLPSYGLFSTSLTPQYWFGIPRSVEFSGLNMDVDLMHYQTVDKANHNDTVVAFHQTAGSRGSAMEHLVPEQMFSTDDAQAQGVSAVKALAIANAQGQKIWTITQDNLNQALNNIDLGIDVETEIRNAVNNGHIATAHEYNINFNGWIGSGYLLIDPQTGAGAYKIAGGGNGSEVEVVTGIFGLIFNFAASSFNGVKALLDKMPRDLAKLFGPIGNVLSAISLLVGCLENGGDIALLFPFILLTMLVPFILSLIFTGLLAFIIISIVSVISSWVFEQINGVDECRGHNEQ